MESRTQNDNQQQAFLAVLLSLVLAAISTAILYGVDKGILKHTQFTPLTEAQFYGILFIIVFGFIAGLLFYREEEQAEEVGEFRKKMTKKKLKKARKSR